MADPDLLDSLFCEAVLAIDAGDMATLEQLLIKHPRLLRDRLDSPGAWLRDKVGGALEGFFRQPYLLWFVAEDPMRNHKLPANIALVAHAIIRAAEREAVESLQEQLDYALRLVTWSCVSRDCGVQIGLIDVLVDAGASLGSTPEDALVNGNFAAARHLVERGAKLTLATALCLGYRDDAARLAQTASAGHRQLSFVLAALNGKAEALATLLGLGVDLNAPSPDLYSHATPVHHAVWSGSLAAVKVLVEAGAALDTRDTVHGGTPLGWAEYGKYAEIAAYLREQGAQED
ncbi:MAG TPA: ankyrin repeat domain-containing protein [Thermoanaerobaculia bacterium]|nr:ankyrin repeat domain-containing protein [Thermoanaerobaculia bacterium]